MSRVPVSVSDRLQVPGTLEAQLLEFRRRVWFTKMAEGIGAAVAGALAAYLALFTIDRLWDSPPAVRYAAAGIVAAAVAIVPFYLHRWVWSRRHMEQLARLLAKKLPRVGDQLLGVIELAHSDLEQNRSRTLCHAAIQQVARDAEQRDLCAAAPATRHRAWTSAAFLLVAAAVGLAAFFPAAAGNAWARLLAPWQEIPRFTFAAVEPLPEEVVAPHGEPFALALNLRDDTLWKPAEGQVQIGGQQPIVAKLKDNRYQFDAPPLLAGTRAQITIGDSTQTIRIEPKLRPELSAVDASINLPEYLGRPEQLSKDVRGGSLSLVKGSRAEFEATASRKLAAAAVNDAPRQPKGAVIDTDSFSIADAQGVKLTWRDEFGLDGKEPFNIAIEAVEDEAPNVTCEDLPRRRVVLDTEQLPFRVTARDDFGVQQIGMEWEGVGEDAVENVAKGEQVLAPGGADKESVAVQGAFTAKSLGIEPQPIELRLYATDYLPGRERVYSPPYLLYVLSPEQHAVWVAEQMSKWHRQALEVRDRELRLHEINKQLRELSPEELDRPDTRRKIENQASAERANGRRLAGLSLSGQELLRQAARNPEIGVGHLDKWAEMLQILQDISSNRMPSVADLLNEGAKASSVANKMPASSNKMAGKARSTGVPGPPTEAPKGAKAPPAAPTLADAESQQHPLEPADQSGEPQKKNPSASALRLPTTTVMGNGQKPKGPAPAAQKVDQAVVEQKDLLAEFEKVANELNTVLANLEGSTLVKRLKSASRRQYKIAGRISDEIEKSFAHNDQVLQNQKSVLGELAQEEDKSSQEVSYIMDDLEAYFERRRMVRFKNILDEMRQSDVIGNLRRLSEDISAEEGLSMSQCEYWSDAMDRWAEDLVDPACSGQCPGCRSKGSLPPSIVLEVLQILEGEVNLREETRVAEQAKAAVEAKQHTDEAKRLSDQQDVLEGRVVKVVDRILELPDAEQEFGKELQLLSAVSNVMGESTEILARPDTGAAAIAAETEAIELLLKSKRINPGGGGGGGSDPGGGGTGTTQDSALALLGAGLNAKEVREDQGTQQAVGESGATLPEEFRAGLDEYFNQLESEPEAG